MYAKEFLAFMRVLQDGYGVRGLEACQDFVTACLNLLRTRIERFHLLLVGQPAPDLDPAFAAIHTTGGKLLELAPEQAPGFVQLLVREPGHVVMQDFLSDLVRLVP